VAAKRARLSKVGDFQCRWIRGEVERDPLCCAAPVFRHSSWCERHYKRVFSQNQRRTKGQVEFMAKIGGIPYKG
jgi:hypothetical protein